MTHNRIAIPSRAARACEPRAAEDAHQVVLSNLLCPDPGMHDWPFPEDLITRGPPTGRHLSLRLPSPLAVAPAGLFCCFAGFLGLARLSMHACLQAACRWRHTTGGTAALRALGPASSGNRLLCGQVMLWVGDWSLIVFPSRLLQPLQNHIPR